MHMAQRGMCLRAGRARSQLARFLRRLGVDRQRVLKPVRTKDLNRMLRTVRPVSASQVVGGAIPVAAPTDAFGVRGILRKAATHARRELRIAMRSPPSAAWPRVASPYPVSCASCDTDRPNGSPRSHQVGYGVRLMRAWRELCHPARPCFGSRGRRSASRPVPRRRFGPGSVVIGTARPRNSRRRPSRRRRPALLDGRQNGEAR